MSDDLFTNNPNDYMFVYEDGDDEITIYTSPLKFYLENECIIDTHMPKNDVTRLFESFGMYEAAENMWYLNDRAKPSLVIRNLRRAGLRQYECVGGEEIYNEMHEPISDSDTEDEPTERIKKLEAALNEIKTLSYTGCLHGNLICGEINDIATHVLKNNDE